MLIAGFGALMAEWRTPWRYRWLLRLPSIGILLLLVLSVVAGATAAFVVPMRALHRPGHRTRRRATRHWYARCWRCWGLRGSSHGFVSGL